MWGGIAAKLLIVKLYKNEESNLVSFKKFLHFTQVFYILRKNLSLLLTFEKLCDIIILNISR